MVRPLRLESDKSIGAKKKKNRGRKHASTPHKVGTTVLVKISHVDSTIGVGHVLAPISSYITPIGLLGV